MVLQNTWVQALLPGLRLGFEGQTFYATVGPLTLGSFGSCAVLDGNPGSLLVR